ncbi:hypothetical protein CHKEEEPN_4042 [Methylorubrum podarium]|nr:hypothetical protein CHKEEEPN_4042 [Methylorubrum podarium]
MAISLADFPEVFVSTTATSEAVSRAVAAGRMRRLASRLYTTNMREGEATLVRRHLWSIVAGYFPDAIIADRTALEQQPASDGSVFLVSESGADVDLPGIRLRPRRGVGRLPGDYPRGNGLYCSSPARAYLENMRPSRARSGVARTLKPSELEDKLEDILRNGGEAGLNRLRDQVRDLAPDLDMEAEAAEFDTLCGTLLGTRDARLRSDRARARKAGKAYDATRIARLELLHDALRGRAPAAPRLLTLGPEAQTHQAFFEAYFSNFIEGTEFEIDEAVDIVFNGRIPDERPEDAHDITGTFSVVANPDEMCRLPGSYEEFERLLKGRHATIMAGRPGERPGEFKLRANKAGSTSFVLPDEVTGTLMQGFEIYRRLDQPLDRATFMMFLVSEVHPFKDGNGRVARIMMNAELAAAGEARIIIPIIFRSNYLEGLKALSLNDRPETILRTLDFAQRYVAEIPWNDFRTAAHVLRSTNAFMRPEEGDAQGIRLRLPAAYDFVDIPEAAEKSKGDAPSTPTP